MYNSVYIANQFVRIGLEQGKPITPLQVLKLVYIAFGWYYALKGQKLFEEKIEAWPYGPVIPEVYHAFKPHGRSEILDEQTLSSNLELEEEDALFLYAIWDKYGNFSGGELSNLTHREGTPWKKSKASGMSIIDHEDVRAYYLKLAGIEEAA